MNGVIVKASAALALVASAAKAQTVVFTDRTSFSNAAGNLTTEDFTTSTFGFPTFTTAGGVTVSQPTSGVNNGLSNIPLYGNISFSTSSNGGPQVTFTLPSAVTAVGVDVGLPGSFGELGDFGATTFGYILSNGRTGSFVTDFTNPTRQPLFFGLTDTDSFTSITFTDSRFGD